ncbi:hypothetical protein EDD16DRAFT_1519668 [Pisolithus croceorrhizus]|nr:hypothetical protein EV401DRAFT_1893433 [Pisolithus croceorrhizus]KAI6118953.1 hypothetical protein EDD16DRAFT_1519668 [Pisolithus croceorrhizus]KAI6163978.1 hypothetical protein EDD17DRAFT_1506870 [Pisolithus thermaeus]
MNPTVQCQDFTPALSSTGGSDDSKSCDSSSVGKAEELKQIHVAITPHSENASPIEVCKVKLMPWVNEAHEEVQNLLLQMHTKFQTLEAQNALLEVQKGKGHRGKKLGNLSNKGLLVTTCKEEATYSYSWLQNPKINLYAAEHWASLLAIKDGMKTEVFKYIPKEDQSLMAHKDFGEADRKPDALGFGLAGLHSKHEVIQAAFFEKSSVGDVQVEADDWELAHQGAFEACVKVPAVTTTQSASAPQVPFPPDEPAWSLSHPVTPLAVAPSISAALKDLALNTELVSVTTVQQAASSHWP